MSQAPPSPRVAVITCAVLEVEVEHFAGLTPNVRHVELLEQGLHNEPAKLRSELQAAIDRVEARGDTDAIVLGYGLCSRGTEGVTARRCRLVMARAHDCITILLGDRQRYARYVAECPGTYWYSPGWNKHHVPPGPQRYEMLRRRYAEQYGEDNADFLMETEQQWFKTYDRAAYVDLTVGASDQDVAFTRSCAQWLGWSFDRCAGDPTLLRDLLSGNWDDERFVVAQPGQTFAMTTDERVVTVVDAEPGRGST